MVERKPYDLLFGERKASDGTPLSRPPDGGRKIADLYARLLAAEPHATADRKHELGREAARQARQSPLFFDLTLSLSKSISIFHASLGENAWLARPAGDRDGDMQLHVHSQIAHTARTAIDGTWRAPDSLGYNEHVGAVAAIVSQHLEEALTRRFGLEWTARDDAHGFEIRASPGR